MQDEKQMKFKKSKPLHNIWQLGVAILAGAFWVFAIINENAAKSIDKIEHKKDILSIAIDIRERRDDEINKIYGRYTSAHVDISMMYCNTKDITMTGTVYADALKEYTSMEIYRAEVAENGGYGEFRKIGSTFPKRYEILSPVVADIVPDEIPKENVQQRYTFTYIDSKVAPGKEYAYIVYAGGHRLDGRTTPKLSSLVKKAFTGSPQGNYKCSIIQNTKKKLIVKLTGENEETGLLKCRIGCAWSAAHLVYKNELYETENSRKLQIIKYSYDGKKWHDDSYAEDGSYAMLTIKGKESVYLWLTDDPYVDAYDHWKNYISEDINFSGYRYAQMMLSDIFYNANGNHIFNLRFNFTSGKAVTGNFTQWNDTTNKWETEWDNKEFQFLCTIDGEYYDDFETYE